MDYWYTPSEESYYKANTKKKLSPEDFSYFYQSERSNG